MEKRLEMNTRDKYNTKSMKHTSLKREVYKSKCISDSGGLEDLESRIDEMDLQFQFIGNSFRVN